VYWYNIIIMRLVLLGIEAKTYSSFSSTVSVSVLLVNIVLLSVQGLES